MGVQWLPSLVAAVNLGDYLWLFGRDRDVNGGRDVEPYQALGRAAAYFSLDLCRRGDCRHCHRLVGRWFDGLARPVGFAGTGLADLSSAVGLRRLNLCALVAHSGGSLRSESLSAGQLAGGRA